ncbi:peptidase domain-containing ABC transporter [Dankookia rubra]|uniref:Peptidase domain-containing ABC transporter n=1 Tax=Dankookia rubra TaxID=1442381 RepID=A0A4R5Q6P0_9PROT|nr:peptidase domain-containing ABC transporter [Dankookia rubra]TDH58213.1 peptidase domain-containing ABC transporter [Dankookia rubra]
MDEPNSLADDSNTPINSARVAALRILAQHVGGDLDPQLLRLLSAAPEVDAPTLVRCASDAGLRARALRPSWRDLIRLASAGAPVMLLLKGGGAALLEGAIEDGTALLLRDPLSSAAAFAVDTYRLQEFWLGVAIVVRPRRGQAMEDAPFNMRWLIGEVLRERCVFRDIGIATLIMSALGLATPLAFMAITDRVLVYHSWPTLTLLSLGLIVVFLHETLLGYAQRHLLAVAAARIDARLNLFVMARLLRLPLDFFEKNPSGEITHRVFQVNRIREFLTGQLFRTFLDLSTLVLLLPGLFFLHAGLTWLVLGCTGAIALIMLTFLPAINRATSRVVVAETAKSIVLGETVHGMRTVKALALEPRQADDWNERVALATQRRLELAHLANWPQTLIQPIERFIQVGTMAVGAYLALAGDSASIGTLMAFAMLSGRVAAPLIALAGLQQAQGEVRAALAEASMVLNQEPERPTGAVGMRPKLQGHLTFEEVSFRYPGAQSAALDRVSFDVPAGTLLGVVGRSGSGKSTVTRLLQGLNCGYAGMVKIDGVELREIDLPHLRRNLGIVLQDNFLFRGSIRENIAAGRPGITFERIIRAARLAGAEEFIERLPGGYETFIQEGSPNLSGGQRQRLAIARAIVTDPAVMILDEATSALDPESEAIVNANLLRIARGRTVVVVSHRLSSLVDADAILVLDRGQVVDYGPHEDLLRRCTIYRTLWQQQNRTAQAKRLIDVAHPAAIAGQ